MNVKRRRIGCLAFGLAWSAVFVITNFGLALAHPVDPDAVNPLDVMFWAELAILAGAAWLFYRAEMKDGEV